MTFVGSICVKRFMGIDARKLFNGMRNIIANREATLNQDRPIIKKKMSVMNYQMI